MIIGKNDNLKGYDPRELKKGIKVEMEHTDDPEMSRRIALDHLAELRDYYTRLHKMEEEGKSYWKKKLAFFN